MKILFTTFSYYPETSGVPVVVQYLAEGLAKRGHNVSVVTCMNGHDYAENGGYPPTQNGDIRSLFWLFSLMALQN